MGAGGRAPPATLTLTTGCGLCHVTQFRNFRTDADNVRLNVCIIVIIRGTGSRGLMKGMATLPQGNQELLVVRDKVGSPPGELGVSKSMECVIFFPSVL